MKQGLFSYLCLCLCLCLWLLILSSCKTIEIKTQTDQYERFYKDTVFVISFDSVRVIQDLADIKKDTLVHIYKDSILVIQARVDTITNQLETKVIIRDQTRTIQIPDIDQYNELIKKLRDEINKMNTLYYNEKLNNTKNLQRFNRFVLILLALVIVTTTTAIILQKVIKR